MKNLANSKDNLEKKGMERELLFMTQQVETFPLQNKCPQPTIRGHYAAGDSDFYLRPKTEVLTADGRLKGANALFMWSRNVSSTVVRDSVLHLS